VRVNLEKESAFGRIDLLTVIFALMLLVACFTPTLARTRTESRGIQCLNNLRRLLHSWQLYAADNGGRVPSAYGRSEDWIAGMMMSWTGNPATDGTNTANWDVTNTVAKSPLWPYCNQAAEIWRCPADPSKVQPNAGPNQGQWVPRVRSFSMNAWFNSTDATVFNSLGFRLYKKIADVIDPGPARTFVFLDERCESINDGEFLVSMYGYPDQPTHWTMVDFPAIYHDGAASFAFADGHGEEHTWRDSRTLTPIGTLGNLNVASPNNKDVYWLMDHATRK
jgi:prepilin-type processing-associated H-X9-DG protein